MNKSILCLIASISALASVPILATPVHANDSESDESEIQEEMLIVGQRALRTSKGATGLNLDVFNTPQSVATLDREFLDTFVLDDVNSALRFVNGVNVEAVETERTSFVSRGFDMKSMQVDGVGIPFTWQLNGSLDTAIYDKVEVIRGANGLLTGTGTPSGTINYIRKRPTNDFAASTELTLNSYSGKRIEADVTTPFNKSGSWAGRAVGVLSNERSWVDRYENDRSVFYAVVDGQLSRNMTFALGYSDQKSESTNPLWGALPTVYSDGTLTDYDVSASNSMDWTFWNTHNQSAFAELTYQLPANWEIKGVVTSTNYDEAQETIWYGGLPDRETGLGQYGWPGGYSSESETLLLDVVANGSVSLFGRSHDLVLGISDSDGDFNDYDRSVDSDDPIWGDAPAFINGYDGDEIPRPPYGPIFQVGDWTYELTRLYGAARINASDNLRVILGFNQFDMNRVGHAYGDPLDASESEFSPYAGIVWSATANTNIYVSYSDIFEPQSELNADGLPLGPAKGLNYELGVKQELFDDMLLMSVALFRAEQKNYAEYLGYYEDTGISYYEGRDIQSEGLEIDVTGYINDKWKLQAGYTFTDLTNADGSQRTYLPENTFNLLSAYDISSAITVGASLRWQDEVYYISANTGTRVTQDSYLLLGVNASWELTDAITLALNVDNLTDEKYHNSYYWADIYAWDQAFYGAPLNGKLRLTIDW